MEDVIIPPDFDNHPVIGPTVKAFIKLLSEIAYRSEQPEKEAEK
jgi:hypothetical protein